MKSSTVKGTPINTIKGGASGISPNVPANYSGAVNRQFEGDQRGNRQVGIATGTAYSSDPGNPGDAIRTRSSDPYGVIRVNSGQDMNNPNSNGNGVILDGMSRQSGYNPKDAATLDSPVPAGSPKFDTRNIRQENLMHLGQGIGAEPAQVMDDLDSIGGVMSRED